ncbi:MAG: IucA/IucC family protein, partial [Rhodospirillales bacterium]|nr:IucA/IucC family protein [Rhodospirillales bacterium]
MAECSARKLSPITAAQAEAGRHCLQTLLNCYCREVAGPNGQVSFGSPFGQNDWPLGLRAAVVDGQVMHLHLPHTATRLIGAVEEPVPLGRLRLRSSLYGRTPGRAWAPLDWAGLAALLIRELSLSQDVPFNDDLLAQIRDSVETVHAILSSRPTPAPSSGLQQYIEAEQALVLGHPFHPAPKSRQGFNDQDRLLYSPELRTSFPLHWFAVRKDMLHQRTLLTHQPDEIIARHAPVAAAPGYSLVPAHPWQAGHILGLRSVRKMLADQTIRDLGPLGKAYLPTSS